MNKKKKLTRSQDDKMLAGICGGLSAYTGISTAKFRLLFVLAAVGYGIGILLYILLYFVIPENGQAAKKAPPEIDEQP